MKILALARRASAPAFVACLLALACSTSSCAWTWRTEGYPADLGVSRDPNVVLWATDANGTSFRGLATPCDESLEPDDMAFDFSWPCNLSTVLPASVGSLSVLLDPNPSLALRDNVNALLAQAARANPSVLTSVTVCEEAVGEIENGEQFHAAVLRLKKATYLGRSRNREAPVVDYPGQFWAAMNPFLFEIPLATRFVLPNAAFPGEYFVVQVHEQRMLLPLPAELPAEVTRMRAEDIQPALESESEWVVFLEPYDMPYELRTQLHSLKQRLTPQPAPYETRAAVIGNWPILYSELRSEKAVLLSLQGRVCTQPESTNPNAD
jgi:hypothetical protein